MRGTLVLFALAALAVSAPAAPVQKDLVYGWAGGKPLKLDAQIPDGSGPFPAVVIVHGGGWSGGDKEDPKEVRPILDPLIQAGYAWFSVNYRLSHQAHYPACIEDVESAIQFVKGNAARFHIDPEKVVLSGDSAGGHIVDMVAVRATPDHPERRLAGVISFYGPVDLVEDSFRRDGPSPSLQSLFGIPAKRLDTATIELLQAASPTAFVSPDLPPFLLLHGTSDTAVDYPGSILWKRDLDALGVPCTLVTIPHGIHVMGNWDHMKPPQTAYKQQMVSWLRWVFARPPEAQPPPPQAAPRRLEGVWREEGGSEVVRLEAAGSGSSLAAPACPLTWRYEAASGRVHLVYSAGTGRDVPYATSPDLTSIQRNRISAAGPRPTVGFADWHYFPRRDLMISADGEIFRRAPGPLAVSRARP